MINSSKIRGVAPGVNIHTASYQDLTNAIGEVRLLLARMVIEKDVRLNAQAREAAQVIHDEEQQERDDFDQHVRETVEGKE